MTIRFARRLAIGLALTVSVMAPAVAHASAPSKQNLADAKRLARRYWEDERGRFTDCPTVRLRVVRAHANYMGFVDPISAPCTINLNRNAGWSDHGQRDSWWQVCATVTHEWGHLPGVDARHNTNPESVMARTVELNTYSSWWPWFPACRYDGDDEDGDDLPDW